MTVFSITRLITLAIVGFAALPWAAAHSVQSVGSKSCSSSEFWYETKSCCLPHGGISTPPSPPKGQDCPPSGYYWGSKQGCCVPSHPPPPNNPPPQCRTGWGWHSATQCCLPVPSKPTPPPSHPSGGYSSGGNPGNHPGHGWKRSNRSRSAALCPSGLDACPISGSLTGYECLDVTAELESCGGCASTGQGQDCTAIKGAWNVGCEQGRCAVYSCFSGFKLSADGASCIPI